MKLEKVKIGERYAVKRAGKIIIKGECTAIKSNGQVEIGEDCYPDLFWPEQLVRLVPKDKKIKFDDKSTKCVLEIILGTIYYGAESFDKDIKWDLDKYEYNKIKRLFT
jgi:hypothetical protein